jgi:hypothetical protein
LFSTISGKVGSIKIVELGVVIGQFNSWRLSRQRQTGSDERFTEFYTFQAECEYINPALFEDADYRPQVFITVQRDRKTRREEQFRLQQDDGHTRSLNGRSLLMEGCRLVRDQ